MYKTQLSFGYRRIAGSSLLIAMVVLLAFSIMVLAASHILLSEQRISTNQNDRRFAFQNAELALREGERQITAIESDKTLNINNKILNNVGLFGNNGVFTELCQNNLGVAKWRNGLCLSADNGQKLQQAWDRKVTSSLNGDLVSILDPGGNNFTYEYEQTPGTKVWANPRYIIELINKKEIRQPVSVNETEGHLYRITARAWGRNKNTAVTLQSFFLVPYKPAL